MDKLKQMTLQATPINEDRHGEQLPLLAGQEDGLHQPALPKVGVAHPLQHVHSSADSGGNQS